MTLSKYRNTKVSIDGKKFDSIKESNRYLVLSFEQKSGLITDLETHPKFVFVINGTKVRYENKKNGSKGSPLTYFADFRYKRNGETIIEDVKGFKTQVYKIKKSLMLAVNGIRILET